MFCHIVLQATTDKMSSYVVCKSYWKMYHWQSDHECGTHMMELWHVCHALQDVLNNTYHDQWIGREGSIA
jgi:hypothetical protein